jgi:hypothetical protein
MNYDGQGGRFGATSVQAVSSAPDIVSAYATLTSAKDRLTLMLINKDPKVDMTATLDLNNITPNGKATLYRYSAASPNTITSAPLALDAKGAVTLPAYSISLLVIETH